MHRPKHSQEIRRALLRITLLAFCFAAAVSNCSAQYARVPTPARRHSATPSAAATRELKLKKELPPGEEEAQAASSAAKPENPLYLGTIALGQIGFGSITIEVPKGQSVSSIDISDDDGADPSPIFKYEEGVGCDKNNVSKATATCYIAVGFKPSDDHSTNKATITIRVSDDSGSTSSTSTQLSGRGSAASCLSPKAMFFPLNDGIGFPSTAEDANNWVYPTLPTDVTPDQANRLLQDFDDPLRKLLVNCFYSTSDLFSAFNQFRSTYNSASGAATVSAELGSLNFINGIQIAVGTNPQLSQSSSNAKPSAPAVLVAHNAATPADASVPPNLATTSAAQATQNILNGGSVFASLLYPFFFRQSTYALSTVSPIVREGVDYQQFNNASFTLTNPSTHTFVGLQAYFKFTSLSTSNSTDAAGYVFFSGTYGYSLMTHAYSLQNGFRGRVNSQIGQVGAGILLKNVATLAAYRGFGPSQTFIDSTTQLQTTANNFKTWSVALSYQKSGSSK